MKASLSYRGSGTEEDITFMDTFFNSNGKADDDSDGNKKMSAVERSGHSKRTHHLVQRANVEEKEDDKDDGSTSSEDGDMKLAARPVSSIRGKKGNNCYDTSDDKIVFEDIVDEPKEEELFEEEEESDTEGGAPPNELKLRNYDEDEDFEGAASDSANAPPRRQPSRKASRQMSYTNHFGDNEDETDSDNDNESSNGHTEAKRTPQEGNKNTVMIDLCESSDEEHHPMVIDLCDDDDSAF